MSKFNFNQVRQNIERVKKELPPQLANDAQNFFLGSFKKQGWDGTAWDEVKRRMPDEPAYKYPKSKGLSRRTKPILEMTGRMRREVSNLTAGARTTYSAFSFKVVLKINENVTPYAYYHNYGTEKIPQRKFMGDSPELRRILRRRVDTYFNKVWSAKAA